MKNVKDGQNTGNILAKKFALKYLELTKILPHICDLPNREFAFFPWDKNYMNRHNGYGNLNEFTTDLKRINPRHIYVSAAIYDDPSQRNMTDKIWKGCDFVVDIDADHMDLPCSKEHDYHFCTKCSYYNKGPAPVKCPECGSNKFKKQQWLCNDCLNVSKREIFKLIDEFLIPDFGFEKDEIKIVFSGHRGYHLHIYDNKIRPLTSEDRRQIADFLTGTGLNVSDSLKFSNRTHSYLGTTLDNTGWRGKIARKFLEILDSNATDFEQFKSEFEFSDLRQNIIHTLFENRDYLKNQLLNRNSNWALQNFGGKNWENLMEFLKKEIECEIDIPVTIDVHRLIRLEGSIHGKTGFYVKPIDYEDLKNFDPFSEPIIFSTEEESKMKVKITTEYCPAIRIKNEDYGPYNKDEIAYIPEAVAIFFACKGVAELI